MADAKEFSWQHSKVRLLDRTGSFIVFPNTVEYLYLFFPIQCCRLIAVALKYSAFNLVCAYYYFNECHVLAYIGHIY